MRIYQLRDYMSDGSLVHAFCVDTSKVLYTKIGLHQLALMGGFFLEVSSHRPKRRMRETAEIHAERLQDSLNDSPHPTFSLPKTIQLTPFIDEVEIRVKT